MFDDLENIGDPNNTDLFQNEILDEIVCNFPDFFKPVLDLGRHYCSKCAFLKYEQWKNQFEKLG